MQFAKRDFLIKFIAFLWLLIFGFNHSFGTEQAHYSLVFFYAGEHLPDYLSSSIAQARLFNKNCTIFFIANKRTIESHEIMVETLRQNNVEIIDLESLEKSEAHKAFDAIYEQRQEDFSIQSNLYWKFTTERFFYIHELMQKYNLQDVFQIECDVMVYINLRDYLELLHDHYKNIACPFQNDYVASVSFIYFAHEEAIKRFVEFIPYQLRGQNIDSDMYLLAAYEQHAPDQVDQLPTITKELIKMVPLKSMAGDTASQPWRYWHHIEDWNSIFDNDNIGTFLEVKRWGAPRILFNTDFYTFAWEEDQEHRWIPYVYEKATHRKCKYRINTLHVAHKGNLKKYLSIGPMPLF